MVEMTEVTIVLCSEGAKFSPHTSHFLPSAPRSPKWNLLLMFMTNIFYKFINVISSSLI
jgi:hypothetical protein